MIDISVAIKKNMLLWPGSPGLEFDQWLSFEKGDSVIDTCIKASLHSGTHIDAPAHHIKGAKTIDELPLEKMNGEVLVVDLDSTNLISLEDLKKKSIASNTKKIILKTSNSNYDSTQARVFQKDYVALSLDAAKWLVNKGIELIGIDYLSVERYEGTGEVHKCLLENEVVLLETLNLKEVEEGIYELICLPVKVEGTEAAPARAVLLESEEK